MIVRSTHPDDLATLPGVTDVAQDHRTFQLPHDDVVAANKSSLTGCATTEHSCPLQWDLKRIHVPEAWETTQGSPSIKVAVLDTGLDSKHEEVGTNYDIADSASFVQPNSFCPADATTYNTLEDLQGHGTWTNTHVAGVDGALMTGIAPRTTLINIRVLGACGFGLDSWILSAMIYASVAGARVESMSLGGYLCADGIVKKSVYCTTATAVGSDPHTFKMYKQVIKFLAENGTVVVAAAGNEHVSLNRQGRVQSMSSLAFSSPTNDPGNDLYGLTEVPGGVPGVIAVAATNRVTHPAKPGDTRYGQYGPNKRDQLTYFSSYGERIDISAPGGARNENVPRFDCLIANPTQTDDCSRLGPSAPSATDNPGDFGAWGLDAKGNPGCTNCYVFIQGTSMATPQVAGVAALALAVHPHMSAGSLRDWLKDSVTGFINNNRTPIIEDDPHQPTWNFDIDYDGPAVANEDMGTGIIDAALAVRH